MTQGRRTRPCIICGADEFRAVCRTDRFRSGLVTAVCPGCGLVRVDPLPDDEELQRFYRRDYPLQYAKPAAPTHAYLQSSGQRGRARHTVDALAAAGLLRSGLRVLDFGCGAGSILIELRRRSADARLYGVEANHEYAAFAAREADARVVAALSELAGEGEFDLIVMSHVLEHLPDPVSQLQTLGATLTSAGAVLIDVPDVTAYRSPGDLHTAHLYHFSPATLAAVIDRAGLHPDAVEQHRPPRHPRSIRCLARRTAGSPRSVPIPRPDRAVTLRLRMIEHTAPMYFILRALLRSARKRRSSAAKDTRSGGA